MSRRAPKRVFFGFSFIAAMLLATVAAENLYADTRQEAVFAQEKLHKAGSAKKLPDDMSSLDAAMARAELFNQTNDTANAEKYFRLVLQKAYLIETQLSKPPGSANTEAVSSPESSQITTLPSEMSDSSSTFGNSDDFIGGVGRYTVVGGDTIRLVAAKLGVTRKHLAQYNQIDAKSSLKIGQQLVYNNRKIVPRKIRDGIVVNIPDRTLYYFQRGKLARSLPVALGTATKNEKYVWQTPIGRFKIIAKQKDPTWNVPLSIQSEMEDQGKDVITSIPPGPENPLGKYAIKTSLPGILIHSTTKPWSIYSYASHGCIRVYPSQMEDFFKEVRVNTPGEIIYKPVKLAVTESGRVFMEVHNDVYNMKNNLTTEARKMIEQRNISEQIDWEKFDSVLKQKSGIAEDISL